MYLFRGFFLLIFFRRNEHSGTVVRRGRLPTEPGPGIGDHGYNSLVSSPIKSPPYNSGATGADSDDSSYKCKLDIISVTTPPTIRTITCCKLQQVHLSYPC